MNNDRARSLSPGDLLAFLKRNLEPGAVLLREESSAEGPGLVRSGDGMVESSDSRWVRLDEQSMDQVAAAQGVVVEDVADGQVLLSFIETSYLSYGFATPVHRRMRRKRRFPIKESTEGIKDAIRGNRALLKHFISLSDAYRKDPQLSSKEATTAMRAILKSLYDAGSSDVAASYGVVDFEPNQMAWISLFDAIGDQTLGQFLGIQDISEIPGGDLDQRADEIRREAGADDVPVDNPAALLASTPRTPANLKERRARFDAALKPMSRYYTSYSKPK